MINVIIKRDYAKPTLISINASAQVHQLKDAIRNTSQSELTDSFKLFITHRGCKKQLNDEDMIMDYGIINNQTTVTLVPAFDGAKCIQFKVFSPNKGQIYTSAISTLSHDDKSQPLDKLIEKYLRTTDINKLFYSGYCPFQNIFLRFNGVHKKLPLTNDPYQFQAKTFAGNIASCNDSFGLIPKTTLIKLMKQNDAESDRYYHDKHTDNINFVVHIEIHLCSMSFILHDKYYYINGEFYNKYDKNDCEIGVNRLTFLPLLPKEYTNKSKIKTLVFGYCRDKYICHDIIPMDITNLIYNFYPNLYGGMYEISEHNKGLSNKLEQKTDTFVISGIEFYFRYIGEYEKNDKYNTGLYLMFNCEKNKSITDVTFLCQLYCKSTKQSFSFIKNANFCDNKNNETIALNDFGNKSSLESIICNIEILNMLQLNTICTFYEYEMILKQNAYLLEWIMDKELINVINKCISVGCKQTFESEIFYNMFMLRCSITEKNEFLFSIQIIALPTNISPLKCKCEIFVVETNHHVASFDVSFDYTREKSAVCYQLLKMNEQLKNKNQLTFRVQVVIENKNEKDDST